MSWIRESETPYIHRFCTNVLRRGPIPKHVAFIMDGNRRFAQKRAVDRAQGHLMGFEKLAETLEWCLDLGINEVTVYAFSIENFKRSKEEVDCLMELAREKFAKLLQEKEMIEKHNVCIRVLGDLKLLPRDIQESIADAVQFSKNNTRATLNVCFAYTSREEMCCAVREVTEGVQLGIIKESDISESLIEKCLYTNKSPDPDLLIRTSGEVRLSDFLLWQSTFSCLSFMEVLWPEFNRWHMYAGILHYQKNYQALQDAKAANAYARERNELESDHACVTRQFQQTNQQLEYKPTGGATLQQRVHSYTQERHRRIEQFLAHLESKRDSYIDELCANMKDTKIPTATISAAS